MSTPVVSSPAASTSTAPAAATTEVAADNFVLMLGQLLGAPVAAAASKPATPATTDVQSDAESATEDAAAVTGVPVPLPLMAPVQPEPVSAEGAQIAAAPAAEGKAATVVTEAILSKGLLEAAKPEEPAQQPGSGPGVQVSQPADLSHQLRATAPDPGQSRPMHHPVGSSAWGDELGTRMLLMSERGQHSASLRLNPEHLGPLEVRISVRDDQASVWFGSSQADTRAALEQALPRLRELFASQGLSLTDAGVHHETPREQGRQQPSSVSSTSGSPAEVDSSSAAAPVSVKLGLVDAYA